MPRHLSFEMKCRLVGSLAECNSIRGLERQTGVHRDTIMRLGARVGRASYKMLDETMRGLTCGTIEIDELWGFVQKKQRFATAEDEALGRGEAWVYIAIDQDTKIVPSYFVGKRDFANTEAFANDLASRVTNKVRVYSDAANTYLPTIESAFGDDVDYGQIVKKFVSDKRAFEERKYSPPPMQMATRRLVSGSLENIEDITTSHVEAFNNLTRTHVKRLARLTNAHSKKFEHHKFSISLFLAYYNFVRIHSTIRMTPAMAHGITKTFWKIADLVGLSESEPDEPEGILGATG